MDKPAVRHIRHSCPRFRVLVGMQLYKIAGQHKLAGIFEHVDSHADWDLELLRTQEELTPAALDEAVGSGLDGVIVSICHDPLLFRKLTELKCPVVVMDNDGPELRRRKTNLIIIRNDPEALIATALKTFAQAGRFAQLAFVESRTSADWSRLRARAFRKQAGKTAAVFTSTDKDDDKRELSAFLRKLALPAAVLAACDVRAADVIAAANEIGLETPRQLSVLGIDNDPYVCTRTRPSIASMEPDFFAEGIAAAKLLDKMMRARTPVASKKVLVGVKRTVLRDSLANLPPAQNMLSRAREYIRKNATRGIAPQDVAAHLRISRPLLDLRFREAGEGTVGECITSTKLTEVRRLLSKTDIPISRIAEMCGFANDNALKNLFKRTIGQTMRDYRTSASTALRA